MSAVGSKDCKDKQFRAVEEQVWDYLEKLDIFKLERSDRICTRVLKELAKVISEPLCSLRPCRGWVGSYMTGKRQR